MPSKKKREIPDKKREERTSSHHSNLQSMHCFKWSIKMLVAKASVGHPVHAHSSLGPLRNDIPAPIGEGPSSGTKTSWDTHIHHFYYRLHCSFSPEDWISDGFSITQSESRGLIMVDMERGINRILEWTFVSGVCEDKETEIMTLSVCIFATMGLFVGTKGHAECIE